MKSEMDQQAIEEQLYKDGKAEGEKLGLEKGRQEGLAEGECRGLEKARQTIARNLLNAGMAADDVAKMTGLSAEAVSEL